MIALEQVYSYQEICHQLEELSKQFYEFTNLEIIGKSHDERDIVMLQIGKGTQNLICTAGVHGRETINPVLLLKMADEYCRAYQGHLQIAEKYDVYELLQSYCICFIPLVNPDGYEIAIHGFSEIRNPILRQMAKMKKILPQNWKYNARGVDINRNFPSRTYIQQQPSEYPGSENETRSLIRIFDQMDSIAYLDFHSRGKIIYYYRQAMSKLYNQKSFQLAKHLQELSNYTLGKKEEELLSHLSGGNSVHYYSEVLGKPALTIETIEEQASFPLNPSYQKESFLEIHLIPLGILEVVQK